MELSVRSHSAGADVRVRGTLQEALILACPESAAILTVLDGEDPLRALRAAGFRIVERRSVSADALRAIRNGVVQRDSMWYALSGGRSGVTIRDRDQDVRLSAAEAAAIVGPIIEVEGPLERDPIIGTFLRQALTERRVILTALAATMIGTVLALVPAAASLYVFNRVIPDGLYGGITLVAIVLATTAAFQAWVSFVRVQTLLYVRARVDLGVARRLLARTLRLPFTHLQKFSVAGLMEAFRGLSNAREILADRVLSAGFDGAMSVVTLAVLAWISPRIAVGLAACAVAYMLVATVIAYVQMRLERREIAARTATRERLIDSIRAIATVKSAGAEHAMTARWVSRLTHELLTGSRRQHVALHATAVRDAMRQAVTLGVLVAGAMLVQSRTVELGSYVALLQLTGAYVAGLVGVAALVQSVLTAAPHLQRAAELSRIEPVPRVCYTMRPSRIVMDKVWFRYGEDGDWVLRDFDAVLEPGCVYRLEGASGAGKTTVLRLLASIYKPSRGRLHVNGIDLDRGGSAFLYLPQDVQLFAGSLLDNLRLLSGGANMERLMRASEELGLAAWVDTLPMRYATVVMGGTTISGGQKQLIALTAAAAADVPVLLLDEAGSNLDPATYRRAFASPVWSGRTIVYVGHAEYAELPGSQKLLVASTGSTASS